jgi:glutamate/aspartate transport system substrate-binding protein
MFQRLKASPALSIQLLAVAAGLFAGAPARAGAALERIQSTGVVRIAYRSSSVPFSYVVDGQPVGYSIDLCRDFVGAIGKAVGAKAPLRVEFIEVMSANRIDTMAAGKADLECESTTNTVERRKRVAFSIPHYVTGARLAVRADSPMQQLHDFTDKRIVSTAGTSPLKAVQAVNEMHGLGMQIREVADHGEGLDAVEHGSADAFVMDEVLLAGLISTRPQPARVKIVGKYLTVEALAIVLPHDDAALKEVVDAEMKQLIRSGTAARMLNRWFLEPIPPKGVSIGLPMPYLLRDFWMYPTDWILQN